MLSNHRIRRIRLAFLILSLATFSAAGAARAEGAGERAIDPSKSRFGGRGRVALDNVVGVTTEGGHLGPNMVAGGAAGSSWGATGYTGIVGYTFSDTRGGAPGSAGTYAARSRTAWASPSVDVFVTDQISLGGTVGVSYTSEKVRLPGDDVMEGDALAISVVPRVGYAIALSEPLTLWPRAGVGYSGARADAVWTAETLQSMRAWIGVVDLGLVYRPTEHVYLHVSPELVLRVASLRGSRGAVLQNNDSVELGLTGGLGVLLNP
ncbi:hypothetical protein WME76_04150 [Sorangium sp. So ce119]|uniref:hypothetical protein n=1 Tax=Sorangium sp. So ce119 TaxID=3133279 RepID=UPI003F5EDDD0